MSTHWARAVLAVVVLVLVHTRVAVAPGWSEPLPVLVLAVGLALAATTAALAVVLARVPVVARLAACGNPGRHLVNSNGDHSGGSRLAASRAAAVILSRSFSVIVMIPRPPGQPSCWPDHHITLSI